MKVPILSSLVFLVTSPHSEDIWAPLRHLININTDVVERAHYESLREMPEVLGALSQDQGTETRYISYTTSSSSLRETASLLYEIKRATAFAVSPWLFCVITTTTGEGGAPDLARAESCGRAESQKVPKD